MQKIFTPIFWDFQSYQSSHVNNLIFIDSILEPNEVLKELFTKFERNLPEIPEDVLNRILARI